MKKIVWLILLLFILAPRELSASEEGYTSKIGWASQYAESPTIGTLNYRLQKGELTQGDLDYANTFVAVPGCERIGERGRLRIKGGEWLNYVVFDCAGPHPDPSRAWMENNNILVELDYWTVERLDLVCRCGLGIEVVVLSE